MTEYLVEKDYPIELTKELLFSMFTIEQGFGTEGNESEYLAELVIAENKEELAQAETDYRVQTNIPEIDEILSTAQGEWNKKIYIFGNAGDGVVFYAPVGLTQRKESR